MDIIVNAIDPISIVAILVMIITLIIGMLKKYSMTFMIIVANIIVLILGIFVIENYQLYGFYNDITRDLAFRPIYFSLEYSPQVYTLFTSMFVHGGFLHLLGNMIVFFFIGSALEERIGWKKFLIIYLLSGVCGTVAHSMVNMGSAVGLVGASGAIFGVMGALAYSYPHDKILMPIPLGIIMVIRRIKVIYAVALFAALETVIVLLSVQDSTAHFAHLGGLVGGFVLAAIIVKRKKEGDSVSFQTTYYDSPALSKITKKDYKELKKLATTPELKEMFKKIENEDVPQVRDLWLEHFLEKVVCPKCKKNLHSFDGKIWCEYCGFRTDY